MKPVLVWLLLVTLFKGLIWMSVVPIWHTPDEQAHFAQVQNFAEGITPVYGKPTTSQEIYTSEILLQTVRDDRGNNSYTYHPQFNIPYASGMTGFHEEEIKQIPKSDRTKLVITEATAYPPLYYDLASFVYRFVYNADLITRVFTTRILSVLLMVVAVYYAYKIGIFIFPEKPALAIVGAALVSFHPMLTFTMTGVNSDVLMNALFTAFIYYTLVFALEQFKLKNLLALGIIYFAGVLTKPTFHIGFLLIMASTIVFIIRHRQQVISLKKYVPLFTMLMILIITSSLYALRVRIAETINTRTFTLIPEVSFANQARPDLTLISHFKWSLEHTIAEVLPWYWGVFKWLGVVLPRWANRLINRVIIVAIIGLVIYCIKLIRKTQLNKSSWAILLLAFAAGSYFFTLTVWDWLFTRSNGYSFGMQGRYLFPQIAAHMLLLLTGLLQFLPQKKTELHYLLALTVTGLMIGFNFVALQTLVEVYYPNTDISTFILQASQYKPWFLKGSFLIATWGVYVTSLIIFLWQLVRFGKKPSAAKGLYNT